MIRRRIAEIVRGFHRSARGFTLLEMVLVILLIGIIAGVSGMVMNSVVNTASFIQTRKDLVATGAVTTARFQRDVGMMLGNNSLLYAGNDSVRFHTATHGIVSWAIHDGKIFRKIGNHSPRLIQEAVNQGSFTYFDSLNNEQAGYPLSQNKRRKVRLIEMKFRLQQGSQSVTYVAAGTAENFRLIVGQQSGGNGGGDEDHDHGDHGGGDDDHGHHGDDGDHGGGHHGGDDDD